MSEKPTIQKILLTIDVEDWFQVENLRAWFPPEQWNAQISRVEHNTNSLLDLFDSFERPIRATFFILGWIAARYPQLIKAIQARGHEVASHGYGHMLCNQMRRRSLSEDIEKSKKMLEDIAGQEVRGYRAPNFSINDAVLELIQECGYKYDSSYNSFGGHRRYGRISTNGHKTGIAMHLARGFLELPISNLPLAGRILPWGGGGYFRFLPFNIFNAGVRKILKKNDAYLFYMHPWEIDPEQPRLKESRGFSAWRHYLNLDKTYSRLARMISSFKSCSFQTCSQYIEDVRNTSESQ